MFDVGFQEIVLIGIIALLVIGPERLPGVARNVGLWVGKVQRFVAGVKTDISKELQTDELRGLLNSQESQIRELKETLTETRNEFARSAGVASSSLSDGMSSAVDQVRGAAEAVKDNASAAELSASGADAAADAAASSTPATDSPADSQAATDSDSTADSTASTAETPTAPNPVATPDSDAEPGKQ